MWNLAHLAPTSHPLQQSLAPHISHQHWLPFPPGLGWGNCVSYSHFVEEETQAENTWRNVTQEPYRTPRLPAQCSLGHSIPKKCSLNSQGVGCELSPETRPSGYLSQWQMPLFRPPVALGQSHEKGGTARPTTKTARAQPASYTMTSTQALPKAMVLNQGTSPWGQWHYQETLSVVTSGCVGGSSDI